jgi:hypothetical protein
MPADTMLEELEGAARALAINVTWDTLTDGAGAGGLCRVKGEWRVIGDRRAPAGEKVEVLAQALAGFDLEKVFLSPRVREIVESHRPPRSEGGT